MILPDVLQANLKVVFCGTAASAISASESAYYANPSNYFWRTLYHTGLTPVQHEPQSFPKLLSYGIGLTDVAKQAIGNDSDLKKSDFDAQSLRHKISHFTPQILAFTSKKGASIFLDTSTAKLNYGQQASHFHNTIIWVLPSPSGAARRYWDITIWQALADTIGNLSDT